MKVFSSWSGAHIQQVALILRDLLPQVINAIEPYVSSEDIEKGAPGGMPTSPAISNRRQ
jgi:hypothetical protein